MHCGARGFQKTLGERRIVQLFDRVVLHGVLPRRPDTLPLYVVRGCEAAYVQDCSVRRRVILDRVEEMEHLAQYIFCRGGTARYSRYLADSRSVAHRYRFTDHTMRSPGAG